jgi:hypothetical protein
MAIAVREKTRNRYFNPNPVHGKKKKHDVGDCVIRSMCKALDQDWDTTYREMCELGFELKAMPNDDITWREYLTRKGFIKHSIKVTKGSKRPTVQSFCKEHNKGTFVLQLAGHLVSTVDGYNYDTWDPADCCLYQYWEKV